MKMCEKKRLKLNDAGMTLIELLVAIAIIAVALVPLLYAFVNSTKYNARAREIQQTTTLAHTVMENCKAYSLKDIKSQMNNGTFLEGVTAAQTKVSGNKMYLTDVEVEGKKYDIVLDFNPHELGFGATAQSAFDILETKSMNPYLDAVFTPMGTDISYSYGGATIDFKAADMDQQAYLMILSKISENMHTKTESVLGVGKGIALTESQIDNSFTETGNPNNGKKLLIDREISILMWNPGSLEQVKIEYKYTFRTTDSKYYYKHIKEDGTSVTIDCPASDSVTFFVPIYTNQLTNVPEHPTKLESVYFFYYPGYKNVLADPSNPGASSVFSFESDKIIVSNQLADGARNIDVYLIKQKNPAYNDTNLNILESSYTTYVEGMYNGSYTSGTNIYHNFDVNLGGGSSTPYNVNSWFDTDLNVMSQLVPTDNKILMYDIVLDIYNAGAYDMDSNLLDSTAEPVLTMEGTTLEW